MTLFRSVGQSTVTKAGDCHVTVSFDGSDGKSVSVIVNQPTSEPVQSTQSNSDSGAGTDARAEALSDKKEALPALLCYDCDQQIMDCSVLSKGKADTVFNSNNLCLVFWLGWLMYICITPFQEGHSQTFDYCCYFIAVIIATHIHDVLLVLVIACVVILSILTCHAFISQICHDGIGSYWNLNCAEHQYSGWSCRPCVDCDGTACGDYWSNKTGAFPMFASAKLGDGQCDYGQAIAMSYDNSPAKHLNWNCEAFKFDLFVLFSWVVFMHASCSISCPKCTMHFARILYSYASFTKLILQFMFA